ncbi:MAG: ATP synthase subunit I [Desulfobacterales bacterium]|nr:ATP synthase subunit I [Desulfobacterales bacterium]
MNEMDIQQRMLVFINTANWILFLATAIFSMLYLSLDYTLGVIIGGFIVTINFHLLARTLRHALNPNELKSPNTIIAKYYIRFSITGVILFFLISRHIVHPLGLIVGLSIVVLSIVLATIYAITQHIQQKEAV